MGPPLAPLPIASMTSMCAALSAVAAGGLAARTWFAWMSDEHLGTTATPWRRFHCSSTCAGARPASRATRSTTSWRSTAAAPWPSGVCACTTMRCRAQKSSSSHCGSSGWRSTWLTAGRTSQSARSAASAAELKLHTPSEVHLPAARRPSIACHTSLSVPFTIAFAGQCSSSSSQELRRSLRRLSSTSSRTWSASTALCGTLTMR
eukprot:7385168-Prymnesium_polylepis.2